MCAWAEFRAALKRGGVPWANGGCRTLVCELLTPQGRNSSALSITLPTQNPSVFFSPPCNEVPALPDTFLVGHCRGCAPGEAGLDISVACNMVAWEGNKDLLGTANPGSTCHIPCLVVPFSISRGPPVFRSSLVWPMSGCYSLVKAKGVGSGAGDGLGMYCGGQSTPILPPTAPGRCVFVLCFGTWIPRLIAREPWTPSPGSGLTAN